MSGSTFSAPRPSTKKGGVHTPLILIILGPPGAGKGTQAAMIQEKLHIPHISTGELLREHIRKQTSLGEEAKNFIDKGQLVPDILVLGMLSDRVSAADCAHGYILDGVPRTLAQAEALQKQFSSRPLVINLELPDAKIIERLTKRIVCEKCGTPYHLLYSPPKVPGVCDKCQGKLIQRSDDSEEVIMKRLKVYHEKTAPLITYYTQKNLLHSVDCDADKEQVFLQLMQQIAYFKSTN